MRQIFWNIFGFSAFTLGIIGILLPLLPTVPFMILAAYCFAQGSQRFHDWLVYHPLFGPPIRNWRERRAIPRYAKYLASIMITISLSITTYLLGSQYWWVSAITIMICALVIGWMWRLPDA